MCLVSRVELECVPARPAGRVQASSRVRLVTDATQDRKKHQYEKNKIKSIHQTLSLSIFSLPTYPKPKNSFSPRHCTPLTHTLIDRNTFSDTHTPNTLIQTSLQLNYSAEPKPQLRESRKREEEGDRDGKKSNTTSLVSMRS